MMNRLNGNLSKDEARRRQLQKYELDKQKHAQKEKEKLDKKRAEKWKRYDHVDLGEALPNFGQTEDEARASQQSTHDDKVVNYILKLERENARLRSEEEKRKQNLQDNTCSASIPIVNHSPLQAQGARSPIRRVPFEANSISNAASPGSSSISIPRSPVTRAFLGESSASVQIQKSPEVKVNQDSTRTRNEAADAEKIKEEQYKREMETVRERMQKLYAKKLKKDD